MMTANSKEKMLSSVDSIIASLGDGTCRKRVDSELDKIDDDLYRLLLPCLVERKTNVAAFVIGCRGSGKSRLVENCLSRLDQSKFHTLRLNGLAIRGNDVSFAVHELVRQLSELAHVEPEDTELLRLKRTNFTWNLELLDEMVRLAKVADCPILIVLDEMDTFAGSSANLDVTTNMMDRSADRQLLLYHILDRVATPGSLLCFIGITSHLGAISLLEKRVRSRAEGTSKTIFVTPCSSYATLVERLLKKMDCARDLRSSVEKWLSMSVETQDSAIRMVRECFERSYRIGNDFRWFSRVLSIALALYREDVRSNVSAQNTDESLCLEFVPKYMIESLAIMSESTNGCERDSLLADSCTRIRVLKDLSEPQVSLLLAARRLLSRDGKVDLPKPLTLERMLNEYQSFNRGHSYRYSRMLLLRSLAQMLELGVFRPSSDHSGGGALHYDFSWVLSEMDETSLLRLPLHLPYHFEAELTKALKDQLLDCSTALREWGRKET